MDVEKVVQNYLSGYSQGRWLLIFDNANDVDMWVGGQDKKRLLSYLPSNDMGAILFTTRSKKTASVLAQNRIIEVKAMDFEITTLMLRNRLLLPELVDRDTEAVQDLLDFFANLPLAIVQAASYINKNSISLAQYMDICDAQDDEIIELLSENPEEDEMYDNENDPVATTWLISFNQIRDNDSIAANYLSFMACMSPWQIPISLLPSPPGQSRKKELDAIGTLRAYSFVQLELEGRYLEMHPLVHIAMRNWLQNQGQLDSYTDTLMSHLRANFPMPFEMDEDEWRSCFHQVQYILSVDPSDAHDDLRKTLHRLCAINLERASQAYS